MTDNNASQSARNAILGRLRNASTPFEHVQPIAERRFVTPVDEGADLLALFTGQARALSATVHFPQNESEAETLIMSLIGEDQSVLAWDFDQLPLTTLESTFTARGITVADPRNGDVRVGITGVEAAFAATGSIVVSAKAGRPRTVSLLPYVHIALIEKRQILPHAEAWLAGQSAATDDFRAVGNHVIITGASRTADIAMELVLGAHGPADLQLVILP